jgi:hypothetical protein
LFTSLPFSQYRERRIVCPLRAEGFRLISINARMAQVADPLPALWPNFLPTGGKSMKPKYLANGFAIAAALAIASPAWAQGTPPAAGAGMEGANPMTIPAPAAPAAPANPNLPAAGAGMEGANPMTIPAHHAVRHAHAMHAHHKAMARKAALTGDTTAQLNREELARIQAGTPPAPAAPAAPANPNLPAAGAGMEGANPMTIPAPPPPQH